MCRLLNILQYQAWQIKRQSRKGKPFCVRPLPCCCMEEATWAQQQRPLQQPMPKKQLMPPPNETLQKQ
ncbi:hypothetical protein KI387_033150, partial [Taxus chinensis]